MNGNAFTKAVAVALLLVAIKSALALLIVATLDTAPAEVAVATTVTNATAPLVIVPTEHVTTLPLFVLEPCVATAETKLNPAGSASVTTIPLPVFGPRLVTESVAVKLLPTFTDPGKSVCPIARSEVTNKPLQ